MGKPLRVLMVEDSENDVLLTIRALKQGGYDPVFARVEDAGAMRKAIREKPWDFILCDYSMPQFNAIEAIALLKETGIDIPIIIVSGVIGEETAVECMRLGARDYIMKGNLSRLVPSVERELKEAESRSHLKRSDEALRESVERFRWVSSMISDVAYSCSMKEDGIFSIDWMTGGAERISGYSIEEIKAQKCWRFLVIEEDLALFDKNVTCLTPGSHAACELRIQHKSGGIAWVESYSECTMGMETPESFLLFGALVDITKRKRAEETLKESEEKYRSLFENANEAIFVAQGGKLVFLNPITTIVIGYSSEELLANPFIEFIHPDDRDMVIDRHVRRMKGEGFPHFYAFRIIHKNGDVRWVELNTVFINWIGKPATLNFLSDITGRIQAEEALMEREKQLHSIVDGSPIPAFVIGKDHRIVHWNKALEKMSRIKSEEIVGTREHWKVFYNEERPCLADLLMDGDVELVPQWYSGKYIKSLLVKDAYEATDFFPALGAGGKWLRFTAATIRDSKGMPFGALETLEDMTDSKLSEKSLASSEAKYRAIFENAIEGIYQATLEGRYVSANPAFAKILGYKTPEELISSITDVASQVYVNPDERSELIKQLSVSDLVEEFEFQAYRKDGTIVWLLANARVIRDENGNIEYFEGRVQDITRRKKAEDELQNTLESLRKAFGATIQVMVQAIEARDPYTAGHQTRSANLARTIATEMGLPQEEIDGIRMAGSIHDIGKLSIPAEILSKPTRLTNIEFSLIKEHARVGFEMLKDVESPWPLAQIVYQHHERMDGSGYPRNLKGDDILMEARILAVADVVEAMASHRPYRPGLGIDAALEEIEKNRGIFYDNAVADACLRLFREKGFQLEGA